jgi:hypothetical protein
MKSGTVFWHKYLQISRKTRYHLRLEAAPTPRALRSHATGVNIMNSQNLADGLRICSQCSGVFSVNHFRFRSAASGSRMRQCNQCHAENERRRRDKLRTTHCADAMCETESALSACESPHIAARLINLMVGTIGGYQRCFEYWYRLVIDDTTVRSSAKEIRTLCKIVARFEAINAEAELLRRKEQSEILRMISENPALVLAASEKLGCTVIWPNTDRE